MTLGLGSSWPPQINSNETHGSTSNSSSRHHHNWRETRVNPIIHWVRAQAEQTNTQWMSAQGGPQDETGPGIEQESLNQVIDQGLRLSGSNQPKLTLRASQLGMKSSHLIFIFNDFLHFFSLHKLKKYCVFTLKSLLIFPSSQKPS